MPLKLNKQRKILKNLKNNAALIVYIEDLANGNVKKRLKREVIKSNQRRHRKHQKRNTPKDLTQCRRTEMYVDFAELNWHDWIMAPGKF